MSDLAPPNMIKRATSWIDLIAKVGAIFGVLFAVQQYLARQADARVERSLEYVRLYVDGGGEVAAAQRAVTRKLTEISPFLRRFKKDLETNPVGAANVWHQTAKGLLHGSDDAAGILSQHLVLVEFFGSLEVCVAARICDEEAALAFFAGPASAHWASFCSNILEQRDLAPDWGRGLQKFVERTDWQRPPGLPCKVD